MSAGRCAAEVAAQAPLAPSICVFDVNETLLDIEFVAPLFHCPTRSLALSPPVRSMSSVQPPR
jgi:hypothetical protein